MKKLLSFYFIIAMFLYVACDESSSKPKPINYYGNGHVKTAEEGAREIRDKFLDKNSMEYAIRFPEKYKEYQKKCGLQRVETCCN